LKLLDIKPASEREIELPSGQSLTIVGLSAYDITTLLERFPEYMKVIVEGGQSTENLARELSTKKETMKFFASFIAAGCGYLEKPEEEAAINHAMKTLTIADMVSAMTEILMTSGGKDASEKRPLAFGSPADTKSDPMAFAASLKLGENEEDGRELATN
jgi:hypothetical protein